MICHLRTLAGSDNSQDHGNIDRIGLMDNVSLDENS